MKENIRTAILTFDDAVKNHLTFVAPLLKKYGFGATFFPCRFIASWQEKNHEYLLGGEDLKAIYDMGFEIGNHSLTHPNMRELEDAAARRQITDMMDYLSFYGIKEQVSFAYPGGPYAGNIVPLLEDLGFRYARTTEKFCWDKETTELMRIPSYGIAQDDMALFTEALESCQENQAVVFTFHGVPDIVHPWCNNTPEFFTACLDLLKEKGFRCCAMKDFL